MEIKVIPHVPHQDLEARLNAAMDDGWKQLPPPTPFLIPCSTGEGNVDSVTVILCK